MLISDTRPGLTPKLIADLRRRSAIEAEIGHMKTDGRLFRSPLKGTLGDALFATLCGCGHNIRKILAYLTIANQLKSRPWRRLVCVVPIRDEDDLLHGLINHYRSLGVAIFILIDNGSANDSASLLRVFTDCEITFVRCNGRFSDARHGVMWINEIVELEICD